MAMTDYRVNLNLLKGYMTQFFATGQSKLTTVLNRLNEHTVAKGNVHNLQPKDIGLGNVPDWLPATKKQADAGVSNNAFMTPKRTDNYVDKNVYQPLSDAFSAAANEL